MKKLSIIILSFLFVGNLFAAKKTKTKLLVRETISGNYRFNMRFDEKGDDYTVEASKALGVQWRFKYQDRDGRLKMFLNEELEDKVAAVISNNRESFGGYGVERNDAVSGVVSYKVIEPSSGCYGCPIQ